MGEGDVGLRRRVLFIAAAAEADAETFEEGALGGCVILAQEVELAEVVQELGDAAGVAEVGQKAVPGIRASAECAAAAGRDSEVLEKNVRDDLGAKNHERTLDLARQAAARGRLEGGGAETPSPHEKRGLAACSQYQSRDHDPLSAAAAERVSLPLSRFVDAAVLSQLEKDEHERLWALWAIWFQFADRPRQISATHAVNRWRRPRTS